MTFDPIAFGTYVRRFRKKKKVTQTEIYRRSGLSEVTMNRIEHARTYVNVYTLAQIAEALDCDLVIEFRERTHE